VTGGDTDDVWDEDEGWEDDDGDAEDTRWGTGEFVDADGQSAEDPGADCDLDREEPVPPSLAEV